MTTKTITADDALRTPSPASCPTHAVASVRSAVATCRRPSCRRFERLEQGVARAPAHRGVPARIPQRARDWVGRPTALTLRAAPQRAWGADVWLKREDLAHTGAHKINNAIGQALLAKKLGAKRVIAETGAGQHGVASAAACARVGLPCTVYMGAVDIERQAPNVDRMRRLGAEVVAVESGDARCARPSTRRCATGCPIPTASITCWARSSARTRTRTSCANCSR